ncbi:MAG: glycosyltransferase [Clostridia bacterium]|nr:glycosyltransferase [Clostridia bacterium]
MRVVQFSDSFIPIMDGVGNVVYRYAQNIAQKGHECYVVAPMTDTGFRGKYPFEIVDYNGIPLWRMKSYRVGAPFLDAHCQKRLNMISADIVHVHSPFIAGQAGVSFAQKRRLPIVGTFHSKYYNDFLQITGVELLAKVGVKYVVDFYEKCTEVWAVSESSAQTLRSYGYKGDIRVMPNGTDIRAASDGGEAAVSEKYGLGDKPVLLFVGQINRKKNIARILEAAAGLQSDFRLVLAGQGPHEKELRRLADELGLGEKAIFTGHISDPDILDSLYKRAQLFVFPSLYDTSGLVVREAAAMGTPSVVVRGSAAAECITDGENGLLCEDNSGDLARVMNVALNDTRRLAEMGERAKSTIPIPWSELVDDVLERYGEIAAEAEKERAKNPKKKKKKKDRDKEKGKGKEKDGDKDRAEDREKDADTDKD